MIPKKVKKEKPIKPKSDIDSFINNELKNLQKMKKGKIQPVVKQNQPVIRDQESEKTKQNLRESMSKGNLNKNPKTQIEDTMNSTASKFDGFNGASKFNETTSSVSSTKKSVDVKLSQNIKNNNKEQPFHIKFPADKIKNEKTKEILDNLNNKKLINNPQMKIKGNSMDTNKKINDNGFNLPKGKMYNEQLNKIETQFYDDYDDYNDFIKDDNELKVKKNEKKEDFEDMFGENAEFNNVDDEYLQPKIKQKFKDKREEILERINDLKGAITLSDQNINFLQFDYTNFDTTSALAQRNINNKKEDASINTVKIEMKEKGISTEYESSILINNNNNNNNNNENKENINKTNLTSENNIYGKEISVTNISSYQPLTYDAYKYFVDIGPYIENILLNNINKYILQKKNVASEQTGMNRLKSFEFPKDLLTYLFPTDQVRITFKKFQFFDTKPFTIIISVLITSEFSSIISNILPDLGSNSSTCNLILLFNIYNSQIEKIFYSFSQINDMIIIGESENILISARADGQFDIFDLNGKEETYFMGYEKIEQMSLARINVNNLNEINEPKFKLILPIVSSNISYGFKAQIKKLIKIITYTGVSSISNINTDKLYDILCIDQLGFLGSFQIRETQTHYTNQIENQVNNPYIQYDLNILIKRVFNSKPNKDIEVIDMKHYNENIIYLLSNFGLCKIKIEGKDTFSIDPIYNNENESNINSMTCFDISDSGFIVSGFNDHSIKVFDINKDIIYSSIIGDLKSGALINKIVWSNVICKNKIGKLIRKTLLANFYVFTTKNDFIIFDLNQKKIEDIRKVKKKKEMGSKQNLTSKNSLVEISDSLFTDYSNYILQSDSSHSNEGKIDIHKLSLRKQYYEENNIERVNDKILLKILSLTNN